ncbi:MAG: hypothetical protein ACKO1W_11690 [Microcystaceae cyanobacterium]
MTRSRIQIVLLCEGKQQLVFARHFLEKRGFDTRRIIPLIPSVAQSGEQFVREQYISEVRRYRKKCNHLAIALIVMTDADNLSVEERLATLSKKLQENALPDRQKEEAIAVFIPKRNIETWIKYLKGEEWSETEKKSLNKNTGNESDCKPQVEALAQRCQQSARFVEAPHSLQQACGEFNRLLTLF